MKLVSKWEELERNLMALERLSASQDATELSAYREFIAKGICFVAYRRGGQSYFAPSRFIGYVGNSLAKHDQNEDKDGRETTPAISEILEHLPQSHDGLEKEYGAFCKRIGAKPSSRERKFWIHLS